MNSRMLLVAVLVAPNPTYPIEIATFPSVWLPMTSSILSAHFRVNSYSDPGGVRKRSTNWPESTCGNNSVPTCRPTSQNSRPHATR